MRLSVGHLVHQILSLCLPVAVRTCTGQSNAFVFLWSLEERLCICIWFISTLHRYLLRQLQKSTKLVVKDYSPTKTTIVWWMWPLPHPPSLPAKELSLCCGLSFTRSINIASFLYLGVNFNASISGSFPLQTNSASSSQWIQ